MKIHTIKSLAIASMYAMSNVAGAEEINLALPTTGHIYFNRPNATIAQHDDEVRSCARTVTHIDSYVGDDRSNGLVGDWLKAYWSSGVTPAAIENCMVVRGWRVVRVPPDEGQVLAKLPQADLSAKIANWVGENSPYGVILRTWNNEAARPSTNLTQVWAGKNRSVSLSVAALSESDQPPFEPLYASVRGAIAKQISVKSLPSLPSTSVLYVIEMRQRPKRTREPVFFRMRDGIPAPGSKGSPTMFAIEAKGRWQIFEIAPGHWQLLGINFMSFCLGAPSFEARPGDIIYGGSFDFSHDDFGLDLSMDPVKEWLVGTPLSERIQPASYSNGWTSQCRGTSAYALEFRGAPFKEGYTWGSNAHLQTSTSDR